MTPKEFFGRPPIMGGMGLAALGGVLPQFVPYGMLDMLFEVLGPFFVMWLFPGVCALGGGVAAGFLASRDDKEMLKGYTVAFVVQALVTAFVGRFIGFNFGLPFILHLALPVLAGLVAAFFGLLAVSPSATAVRGRVSGGGGPGAGGPPQGPLPFRSIAEEHLYMELRPCSCGRKFVGDSSSVVEKDGKLISLFSWNCAACGTARRFEFLIPETTDYTATPDHCYGLGNESSKIIDAGQFLATSDRFSRGPAAPPADPAARQHAADQLSWAIAALEEVLKFIPTGERSEPPASAMWSADSRRLEAAMPGQFQRFRLEARLGAYKDLLAKYRA